MERERSRSARAEEQASPDAQFAATIQTLEDGVSALIEEPAFRQYLDAMGRFHQYSFANISLIMSQRPDATQVAGYRTWQSLGRQVRKGERGIRILVPHRRKLELEEGEETTIVRGFGVGSVFDVRQTDGEPLPEPPAANAIRTATDSGAALYTTLSAYLMAQGLRVVREDTKPANGYYAPARGLIAVDADLDGDQATKTLVHETAHFVAAHRSRLPREDTETVAESTAYVVLTHYGIDSSSYTFPYVARWAEDRAVLKRNLAAIQQTSHAIITAIEQDADDVGVKPQGSLS